MFRYFQEKFGHSFYDLRNQSFLSFLQMYAYFKFLLCTEKRTKNSIPSTILTTMISTCNFIIRICAVFRKFWSILKISQEIILVFQFLTYKYIIFSQLPMCCCGGDGVEGQLCQLLLLLCGPSSVLLVTTFCPLPHMLYYFQFASSSFGLNLLHYSIGGSLWLPLYTLYQLMFINSCYSFANFIHTMGGVLCGQRTG